MNSRLPDPRLNLIYRLEANLGHPQDIGDISAGHRRIRDWQSYEDAWDLIAEYLRVQQK